MAAKTKLRALPSPTGIRCAIYTRKSTDEGLDQDFNSLDAQREAAEAYISSQRGDGWTLLTERYDDGGFTGANLERPALEAAAGRRRGGQGRLHRGVQARQANSLDAGFLQDHRSS